MTPRQAANVWEPGATLPQRLLDLLFPPRCAHCGRTGEPLCATCRGAIHAPPAPRCERCDQPIGHDGRARSSRCAACVALARQPGAPALERIVVASVYEGPAGSAIRALKFRRQRRLGRPLGHLLIDATRRAGLAPDLIIPMPLHASRKRERGFNQATLLARPLAGALHAPLHDDLLARIRMTQPQTRLTRSARRANVAGAFAVAGEAARLLAGKRVLLVDDVTTTGATLEAAAEALRVARPASIYALAVARPLRSDWLDDDTAPDLPDL